MAGEWVPHVATATVGVAGILGTWLTGSRNFSHERRLAKEAREQQRRENAYVELLEVAERVGHWAQMSWPSRDPNPREPKPEMPPLTVQAHTEALVRAFGSEPVLAATKIWRDIVRDMSEADSLIRADTGGDANARRVFDELRPRERAAREELGDEVAADLGHRTRR